MPLHALITHKVCCTGAASPSPQKSMEILRFTSSPWEGLEIPLAGSQPSRCLCRGFILGERSQRPSEAATGVNHGRFNPGVGALPRSARMRARRRAGLNADEPGLMLTR